MGGYVPDGVVVGFVAAATEDEVFDCDDADEGGGPVSDEGDKVLEVDEKVSLGSEGYRDHDDGYDDGEGVSGDLDQAWDERLEVECYGVHGSSRVAEEREGEDDNDEFSKAACARKHGCEDTADKRLTVGFLPLWNIGKSASNGSAKSHEENRGCEETKVAVRKDPPRRNLGIEIRRQIARNSRPRNHVTRNNHAKAQNLRSSRRRSWGSLLHELRSSASRGDGDGDDGGDEGVRLVVVQDLEAAEGDEEGEEADDDDSHIGG